MKVQVYRIKQPGFLPALIRFGTRSKWNHLMLKLQLPSGWVYAGLDNERGREYIPEENFPANWVQELVSDCDLPTIEADLLIMKMPRYEYSHFDNVIAFLGKWLPFVRKFWTKRRPGSLKTNCVGFVDQLLKREISYRTPGDWR